MPDHSRAGRDRWPRSTPCPASDPGVVLSGSLPTFLDSLVSHYVLDGGKPRGRSCRDESSRCKGEARAGFASSALFGETTGETDDFGLPVRYDWAKPNTGVRRWSSTAIRPIPEPEWLNQHGSTSTPAASSAASLTARSLSRTGVRHGRRPLGLTASRPEAVSASLSHRAPALSAQQIAGSDLLDADGRAG